MKYRRLTPHKKLPPVHEDTGPSAEALTSAPGTASVPADADAVVELTDAIEILPSEADAKPEEAVPDTPLEIAETATDPEPAEYSAQSDKKPDPTEKKESGSFTAWLRQRFGDRKAKNAKEAPVSEPEADAAPSAETETDQPKAATAPTDTSEPSLATENPVSNRIRQRLGQAAPEQAVSKENARRAGNEDGRSSTNRQQA